MSAVARVTKSLEIAVEALEAISDEKQTSLRWRRSTIRGLENSEKPNCRLVARQALTRMLETMEG